MSGIGDRLREERERLGLSQAAFGDIGGVKANAQGNYEKGDRFPDASYLAAVAIKGVDVLYVVTGNRVPAAAESLSEEETTLLKYYRTLPRDDRGGILRTTQALAEMAKR
jgi:transcriptional regulator with XRE-family HTH domain